MIDKLNLKAELQLPGGMVPVDGMAAPAIATFEGEIQLTTEVLHDLTHGGITLFGIHFAATYNKDGNLVTTRGKGHLPDTHTEEKILELAKVGWVFDPNVCAQYKLNCPPTSKKLKKPVEVTIIVFAPANQTSQKGDPRLGKANVSTEWSKQLHESNEGDRLLINGIACQVDDNASRVGGPLQVSTRLPGADPQSAIEAMKREGFQFDAAACKRFGFKA